MADYKLITMILIMLGIQTVLFMSQNAMNEVNPLNSQTVFDYNASLMQSFTSTDSEGNIYLNATDESFTIETDNGIDVDTGNPYSDSFKSIKNLFSGLNTDFGFVKSFFSQPYGFMIDMGIPQDICIGFGLMWYITLLLLFVGFVRGSNQ